MNEQNYLKIFHFAQINAYNTEIKKQNNTFESKFQIKSSNVGNFEFLQIVKCYVNHTHIFVLFFEICFATKVCSLLYF